VEVDAGVFAGRVPRARRLSAAAPAAAGVALAGCAHRRPREAAVPGPGARLGGRHVERHGAHRARDVAGALPRERAPGDGGLLARVLSVEAAGPPRSHADVRATRPRLPPRAPLPGPDGSRGRDDRGAGAGPTPLAGRARNLAGTRRAAGAIALLGRAAALRPHRSGYQAQAGLALLKAGRAADAVPYLDRAVAMQPGNLDAVTNLGLALVEVGHAADALPYLERAAAGRP